MEIQRRIFIQRAAKGVLFLVSVPIIGKEILYAAFDATPSNTEGPYYKSGAPYRTVLLETDDPGTPLTVTGQVIDKNGNPLPQSVIEIWQANSQGIYDMDGYRYRAKIPLDSKANYEFQTVLPGNYGGRPKHIHYKIGAPEHEGLTTQLYFATDSFFEGNPDRNFRKDPIVQHRELIRPVSLVQNEASVFFRICLL